MTVVLGFISFKCDYIGRFIYMSNAVGKVSPDAGVVMMMLLESNEASEAEGYF